MQKAQSSDEEAPAKRKAQKGVKKGKGPKEKRSKIGDESFFQDLL